MKYDLIIIGSGPAGLSSAIYAARYKLNTIVIGKETGGMAVSAHKVCNYPSYPEINGMELIGKFISHARQLGAEIVSDEVASVTGKDGDFIVKTRKKKFRGKKIIYAGGTVRSTLNVGGEERLIGKGVSYCATCDAPFFREKNVGVVGGGDSALTSALLLTEFAEKVIIIYRQEEFRKADPSWIELVEKNKKISCEYNEEVAEILGENNVEGVKLKSGKKLNLGGLFVEIGSVPYTYVLKSMKIKKNKKGYIITDKAGRTSIKGLFAVGDITDNSLKQIITAAGEGATAAFSAFKELRKGV